MRQYANFSGRMARSDFWIFSLVLLAIFVLATALDASFSTSSGKSSLFFGLAGLVHLLPQLAANVRRLHDADRSGWWMLLWLTGVGGVVVFILLCLPGTPGSNSFGASPASSDGLENSASGSLPVFTAAEHTLPTQSPAKLISEIERLSRLYTEGSLTDSEFEAAKSRILSKDI